MEVLLDALSQGSSGLKVLSEQVLDMKLYPIIYKVMAVDASVSQLKLSFKVKSSSISLL